ncbi:MAG: hypothetical protein J6R82_02070 [Clostridia bacterium]|nr:hypothetical protein [Clostridia bacterium]
MKQELYQYDIYPLVFPVGKEMEFTVKPLGTRESFHGEYTVTIHRIDAGAPHQSFSRWNSTELAVHTDEDGALRFRYTADTECEHYVRIFSEGKRKVQLPIYAVDADLACRYPLRGDLHMHTYRSDGRESPAVVCANYRKKGYDFIVITDHERYYPSLEAIAAFQGVTTALNILPGEEVHLPGTDVHIVNAGGLFSVNGLLPVKANYTETDGDLNARRLDDSVTPPEVLSLEQYTAEIDAIEARLKSGDDPIPENVNSRWYAVCLWGFEKIREAGGLGIFAHPYWISDLWQIPEAFTRYMMKEHPFDAFEVLGGENYYQQNGFQTALYYDEYREGRVHPIVGSTDSHGSTEHNRNSDICSTIVFAKANERGEILSAIKDRYSLAVDTISKEYRLVGEFRLQKYGAFLMENYFPLHDRQAALDGELMYQYVIGNATNQEVELIAARADRLMKKYIQIS